MTSKVLAIVYKYAVNGDKASAKLYFILIGNLEGQPMQGTVSNTQNNFIQINETLISQNALELITSNEL